MLDLKQFYQDELIEHLKVAVATQDTLQSDFEVVVEICLRAIRQKKKLLFFGNGGSAADAQHLATELTVRYKHNRPPIAAIALTTDTSALTAIGNDFGFEHLFSRQIEAIGQPGDVVIGITTSGKSPNVIKGFEMAKNFDLHTIALTGCNGGLLIGNPNVDKMLIVPSHTTSRIQEMHIMLGQMLCNALEISLGLVQNT